AEPDDVERGQEDQRQQRANEDPADHGIGHGLPEHFGGDRDEAKAGGEGRQQDRADAMFGGVDHGLPRVDALAAQMFDLHDEDDRVADENANKRQHTQNGNETEWLAEGQERCNDADEGERGHGSDEEEPRETLQLDHQHGGHDEEHERDHA